MNECEQKIIKCLIYHYGYKSVLYGVLHHIEERIEELSREKGVRQALLGGYQADAQALLALIKERYE